MIARSANRATEPNHRDSRLTMYGPSMAITTPDTRRQPTNLSKPAKSESAEESPCAGATVRLAIGARSDRSTRSAWAGLLERGSPDVGVPLSSPPGERAADAREADGEGWNSAPHAGQYPGKTVVRSPHRGHSNLAGETDTSISRRNQATAAVTAADVPAPPCNRCKLGRTRIQVPSTCDRGKAAR